MIISWFVLGIPFSVQPENEENFYSRLQTIYIYIYNIYIEDKNIVTYLKKSSMYDDIGH